MNGTARLVGGAGHHEGRVEVFIQGAWRSVCHSWTQVVYGQQYFFDDAAAGIVCRQLGYLSGPPVVHKPDFFAGPAGPSSTLALTAFCEGGEAALINCPYSLEETCTDHAAVTCPEAQGKAVRHATVTDALAFNFLFHGD